MNDNGYSISLEHMEVTMRFAGGGISTIPGHKEYREVENIFKDYFTELEVFDASPSFFEMYKNSNDLGFVVDVEKKEVRVVNKSYNKLCKDAILECGKSGLEFKLK